MRSAERRRRYTLAAMQAPRPPVKVRPVSTAAVGALRELRSQALRTCPLAFRADLAQTEARPADAWREHVARATGDGTELIVLAEDGDAGRLVGMAGVHPNPEPKLAHVGTVWGVYVRPAARGRGAADSLVRACIDWARGKDLATLKL